ncbi:MAG: hypothetical protein GY757_62415, partial [bacterium]|nr:hypothetical protein [bacterium]
MENEYFKIEIDILEANDIYKDLICLEVEVGDELADMARITLAIEKKSDGNWTYLDDPRFTLWKEIKIVAGFQGSMETLFIGYITRVKPNMARDIATSTLSIWAVQKCVAMDREEKLIAWKNMKDSDIAKSILSAYGFVPYVKDTEIVPEKDVASVIQRETDLQFLKRLAQNNGYHFYVENNDAYFEKPKLKGESSQPVLAYDFGQETSVKCLSIDANGL